MKLPQHGDHNMDSFFKFPCVRQQLQYNDTRENKWLSTALSMKLPQHGDHKGPLCTVPQHGDHKGPLCTVPHPNTTLRSCVDNNNNGSLYSAHPAAQ